MACYLEVCEHLAHASFRSLQTTPRPSAAQGRECRNGGVQEVRHQGPGEGGRHPQEVAPHAVRARRLPCHLPSRQEPLMRLHHFCAGVGLCCMPVTSHCHHWDQPGPVSWSSAGHTEASVTFVEAICTDEVRPGRQCHTCMLGMPAWTLCQRLNPCSLGPRPCSSNRAPQLSGGVRTPEPRSIHRSARHLLPVLPMLFNCGGSSLHFNLC